MNITIHRGLEQIGGCITEICTATSRVFIDLGKNLPGNGEATTPEQDKIMVETLFRNNQKEHTAVIYTHVHEDHIGLFDYVPDGIPQMVGEGAKEIILEKYRLLCEADKLAGNDPETNQRKYAKLKVFKTWPRSSKPVAFSVGDIRITPYYNCHSIYDSYMFLIEADGKRIWHMGDYRQHGWMGGKLLKLLKWQATDIDVLITEGTMLSRDDECIHESVVAEKMAHVMQAFKYVFVLVSATDIERLASINFAAKEAHKPLCVCSGYINSTMRIFTGRESKRPGDLFDFKHRYYDEKKPIEPVLKRGFVMCAGVSQLERVDKLRSQLPEEETLLIYSTWDGYYKDTAQVEQNPGYKKFRETFHNVVDIHTSGHASRQTIKAVIETVNPKEAIVGIHKDKNYTLDLLDLSVVFKKILIQKDSIAL